MAETYSTQYTQLYLSEKRASPGLGMRGKSNSPVIDFNQGASAGTIGDTILLEKLPAPSVRILPAKWIIEVNGWTAATTLSIGWKAYRDRKGAAVAASANGIVNALAISTDGRVHLAANAALQVMDKQFASREGVDIVATINGAAPAANATLKLIMDFNQGDGS